MADPVDHVRIGADIVAATTIGASILQWVPPTLGVLGSLLGVIWFIIQICESRTIRHAIANWRQKRRAIRVRKLRSQEKIILAKLAAFDMVRSAKAQAVEKVEHAKVIAKAEEVTGSPELDAP